MVKHNSELFGIATLYHFRNLLADEAASVLFFDVFNFGLDRLAAGALPVFLGFGQLVTLA
jgi:hypothetical protein